MKSPVNPELVAALKRLRLGRIAETLPDRMLLAEKQDMPFDDLLLLVVTDEISRRDATAASNRSHAAGLDHSMTLELFDKTESDLIPECKGLMGAAAVIQDVMDGECQVLTF